MKAGKTQSLLPAPDAPDVIAQIAPLVKPAAWDAWFAGLPESENIEDRRWSEPELGMKKHKPLVQFPPYEDPSKRGPR
jgi:hypothetical protein